MHDQIYVGFLIADGVAIVQVDSPARELEKYTSAVRRPHIHGAHWLAPFVLQASYRPPPCVLAGTPYGCSLVPVEGLPSGVDLRGYRLR